MRGFLARLTACGAASIRQTPGVAALHPGLNSLHASGVAKKLAALPSRVRFSLRSSILARLRRAAPTVCCAIYPAFLLKYQPMKGIVLAGGLGSRLYPLTKITNKHLLPIYNRPMIYYPIQTLVDAGISEILVVTGGKKAGDFLELLGNGKEFGLSHLDYTYQEGEGGIAAALSLAEYFVKKDSVCVILGDNVYEKSVRQSAEDFIRRGRGAKIHLKRVENPQRFGVPVISGDRILKIEEKPKVPQSDLAVTGLYMYDHTVFDIIKTLKPSGRGELEITDVNNAYIERGEMTYAVVDGWWSDAGTFDSLLRTNILVASQFEGNPEEISQAAIQTSASMLR
jgi:glucose-1-phosphate thymidylyltransferase